MQTPNLTNENFQLLAAQNYRNVQCSSTEEFLADLKRIKYIKKIISRFISNNVIDERLVLNHIIILYNCFGAEFLCRIFFLKMFPQMEYLKPFLVYLRYLTPEVQEVEGVTYDTNLIPMNPQIIEKLRELEKHSRE